MSGGIRNRCPSAPSKTRNRGSMANKYKNVPRGQGPRVAISSNKKTSHKEDVLKRRFMIQPTPRKPAWISGPEHNLEDQNSECRIKLECSTHREPGKCDAPAVIEILKIEQRLLTQGYGPRNFRRRRLPTYFHFWATPLTVPMLVRSPAEIFGKVAFSFSTPMALNFVFYVFRSRICPKCFEGRLDPTLRGTHTRCSKLSKSSFVWFRSPLRSASQTSHEKIECS